MTKIGTITPELINQIVEANELTEVAQDYGIDAHAGGKARCPFHKDGKNGNLHFYNDGTYYCYTCSAGRKWEDKEKRTPHVLTLPSGAKINDGGPNVIGFVMNIEQISYPEAVKILCERGGIPVPKAYENPKHTTMKKKQTVLNKNYCSALLKDREMLNYLKERQIKRESIKKFRLGVVPLGDGHYPFKERIEGRLVFGITEEAYNPKKAKTIAMAYRAMTDEQLQDGKYLNDYKSEIYNKSEVIYGLNEAKRAIRQRGFAIVTEGYVDVIIAHQSEVENTVAICGTAFTREQMEKLRKLTDKLVFWLDGDSAGHDAMIKNLPMLLELGFRVMVVDSVGYDPAELMNKLEQDKDRIDKFIEKYAKPALQVLTEDALSEYEAAVLKLKTEALDELLPLLQNIKDPSEQAVFRNLIETRVGVTL